MPIRWYGPADPEDPTYRHFERIVNLTLHAMVFAALNSGLWVLQGLRHPWPHLEVLSIGWAAVLLIHASVVLRLRPAPAASEAVSEDPGPPAPPAQDAQP
jgi:hypothetical protein